MSLEDLMQRLLDDLLADVLRRLQTSPRSLAVSRCVCKAWGAIIDARRLLTDLLPHSLAGMFLHLRDETLPKYFSLIPPTEIAAFDYLDTEDVECLMITQHCNGLLLLGDEEARVLNPATREWARLPPPPPMCTLGMENMYDVERCMHYHEQYLVFDPTESLHYEVFLVGSVPWIPWPGSYHLVAPHIQEREWPPSTFILLVLSSRTNQWEERPFVREGEAACTIGYMLEAFPSMHPYAVYWRGALYIRQYDFVMRITLSSQKYQVIELPENLRQNWYCLCLGKSESGVYCAVRNGHDGPGLQIWYLDEMCDQINWMLKCDVNLHALLANFSWEHGGSPSTLQCANCVDDDRSNATGTEGGSKQSHIGYSLLGFHPNKKVVFFHTPQQKGSGLSFR